MLLPRPTRRKLARVNEWAMKFWQANLGMSKRAESRVATSKSAR